MHSKLNYVQTGTLAIRLCVGLIVDSCLHDVHSNTGYCWVLLNRMIVPGKSETLCSLVIVVTKPPPYPSYIVALKMKTSSILQP